MNTRFQAVLFTAVYACGIVWAIWLAQIHISGRLSLIDRLETYLLDLRILANGPQTPSADVVIVAIDDETVDDLGRFPLGRGDVAEIVEKIAAAGASALAVDILLAGTTQEAEDNRLAEALKKLPSLIASAGQFNDRKAGTSPFPTPDRELMPLPLFVDAAQTGLVNVSTDGGGTPRYLPMVFQTSAGLSPSFALRAAGLFLDRKPSFTLEAVRVGGNLVPLDLKWHLPLRYYGPGKSIKTLSATQLLSGTQQNVSLDGRLVVLAVTATAVGDRFNTPFDPILPGAEVLATGISNLLQGSGLERDGSIRRTDGAVTLVFTVFGMLAMGLLPLATATVLYIIALVGWLVFTAAAYANGYWFNGILPLAGSIAPVIVAAVMRQGFDLARFRRMARARDALSRFHAPGLAARISDDPEFLKVPRQQNA
ncbi:MAG: CHASE2 domain-containing protein, partial [Roseobacter sp.]